METALNKIFNEDCFQTMKHRIGSNSVDVILTSPPYNTSRKGCSLTDGCANIRYDVYDDRRSDEDYTQWTVELFQQFDKVLKPNGCVLYNLSYSSEKTHLMWDVVSAIQRGTSFIVADCIVWKKPTTSPNSCSMNKLTRIVEYIFVFCRRDEFMSFKCYKGISSVRKTGQIAYHNVVNLIEAPCNDGANGIHFATFSTVLVRKLLEIYTTQNDVVYDPFMGIGTTAIACAVENRRYIGSEISERYCKYAEKRISIETLQLKLF